jgi:hypothetical protein
LRVLGAVTGRNAIFQAHSAKLVQGSKETRNFLGSLLQVIDRHNETVSQSGAGSCLPEFLVQRAGLG